MPSLVVQKNGLQLGERADGKEGVEDLMSVAHNVTRTWEVLLGYRAGEEVGANQEEDDLEGVIPGRLFLATSQVTESHPVGHRADVENEGQPGWDHLTDLPHHWIRPSVAILGVATASAGKPATESSCRQEEEPEPLVPRLVRAVEKVSQCAAILIDADPDVVHKVKGVVRQL